jgi:peptidoglycan/LPS O-acetylase OafA/YrhL
MPRRHLPKLLLAFALAHFFLTRPPHVLLWWMRMDALAGLTLFVVCLISAFGPNSAVSFQTGFIAVLSAGLVWVASYDKGYICPAGRAQRLLIWIGARSYALYLVHPFAFFGTREIMGRLFPGQVFNDNWLPFFLVLASPLLLPH